MSKPIEDLPKFIHDMFQDSLAILRETADRVKERMAVSGKPIVYPVQWDSAKQRKAFFASNGFGGGIPYQRRNVYPTLWQVSHYEYGARLFADHPAGAVGGIPSGWQSRIYRNRYPHLLTVLFEELSKIPTEMSNKFSVRSGNE